MNLLKEVKLSCIEQDKTLKAIAAEYKRSSRILKKRINKIKKEISDPDSKSAADPCLNSRLNILNQMFRTTCEIGREAERYYEKGWWRSEAYTLNAR